MTNAVFKHDSSKKLSLVLSLMGLAVLFRCFSIWPNLSPVLAVALFLGFFGARTFGGASFSVGGTLLILIVSDLFLGFHETMPFVYAPLLLMAFLAKRIQNHPVMSALGFAAAGSILFFVVSNFGVWFSTPLYSKTWSGLVECYGAAIPFYRWTLLGDLIFTGAIFGIYTLVGNKITSPSERAAFERAGK